jgi:DNA modification methylase
VISAAKESASGDGLAIGITSGAYQRPGEDAPPAATGTSIFDPVLCEIAYRWFCPFGGVVLDPFAGGSVRGVVASRLGRRYVGIDLSARQVAANRVQGSALCADPVPAWHVGDSRALDTIAAGVAADFLFTGPPFEQGHDENDSDAVDLRDDVPVDLVFSCPPYAHLERYSDDVADLSTLDYPAFRIAYAEIIGKACALLKPDRFACFVVGDVRDRQGLYYGFPGHTVAAFELAGLRLYNEAILVTAAGSLPIRAAKQFKASRKLGKTHQNVLVFVKGDPRRATAACGTCQFGDRL